MKPTALAVLIASLVATASCATDAAGPDHLPSPEVAQRGGHGGWVEVTMLVGNDVLLAAGELLAIERTRLWVLTRDGLASIPMSWVRKAKLVRYKTNPGAFAGWGSIGVVSTLSHGFFLILSAPIWTLTSAVVSHGEAGAAKVDLRSSPEEFRKYSRFPQGMPANLAGTELGRMKRLGQWPMAAAPLSSAPRAAPAPAPPTGPGPSPAPAPPPTNCQRLLEPPPGADLLCSEHVLGNSAEIEWQSYGTTEERAVVNQRYLAAAAGCQVRRVTQPPAFSLHDGDRHLDTYDANATGYPTCQKAPAATHKTVIVISHMMRR